ncbi:MAG: substrate-binding domain-containing protein [Pseudomonadota bacterium]
MTAFVPHMCLAVLAAAFSTTSFARYADDQLGDHITVVGSSTVYPFAHAVAEQLEREGVLIDITPTGTGGGVQFFCSGSGEAFPAAVMASRPIKPSERNACAANGSGALVERVIGVSGIVFAQARGAKRLALTRRDIFLAAAARVPSFDDDCTLIDNPYRTWRDIRPSLPDQPIALYGPPLSSGTRASFVDLALVKGASAIPCLRELKKTDRAAFDAVVNTLRIDGGWIDAGENDPAIATAVHRMKTVVGVFGYAHFAANRGRLIAAEIEGVEPTEVSIQTGEYPLARTLRVYAKADRARPGSPTARFLDEFSEPRAIDDDGYLRKLALLPAE